MSRIANRPLLKPRQPNRFADLGQVILAILLLIIPALLYASQRAELHRARRQIAALEQRLAELEEARQHLVLEYSTELDPRRMRDKARSRVGLVVPSAGQIVHLDRGADAWRPPLLAGLPGGPDGHP
ncbi:MAG: hypothetical protein ACOC5E_02745 [Acidobacteriota bacterium]